MRLRKAGSLSFKKEWRDRHPEQQGGATPGAHMQNVLDDVDAALASLKLAWLKQA
jgi:hypothetical protein